MTKIHSHIRINWINSPDSTFHLKKVIRTLPKPTRISYEGYDEYYDEYSTSQYSLDYGRTQSYWDSDEDKAHKMGLEVWTDLTKFIDAKRIVIQGTRHFDYFKFDSFGSTNRSILENVSVRTGAGDDKITGYLYDSRVHTGTGDDEVRLERFRWRSRLNTGSGDDIINVDGGTIRTGSGKDHLTLHDRVTVQDLSKNDTVELKYWDRHHFYEKVGNSLVVRGGSGYTSSYILFKGVTSIDDINWGENTQFTNFYPED